MLSLVWPNDRRRYYANIHQCWTDALNGNMPIHEAGSRLVYVADAGSKDWGELQSRAAEQGPVFD